MSKHPCYITRTKDLERGCLGKEPTCNAGDPGLLPGSGRSTGEGIGCPLQYSWASLLVQKAEPTCNEGDLGSIPDLGRSLEEIMATHSSIIGLPCWFRRQSPPAMRET